jgi:hypothetical protein
LPDESSPGTMMCEPGLNTRSLFIQTTLDSYQRNYLTGSVPDGLIALKGNVVTLSEIALSLESDHVPDIAFSVRCDSKWLEDIEHRRQAEAYLNALGADRIPDPTTAGDFCRRSA